MIPTKMINQALLEKESNFSVHSDVASRLQIKEFSCSCRHEHENLELFKFQVDYEILIVKKGKGHFLLDGNQVDILDNTVYLVSPGQIYKMRSAEAVSGYTISFTQKVLNWNQGFNKPTSNSIQFFSNLPFFKISLEQDLFANIELIVLNMISEVAGFNPDKEELLNSFFKIIIIYLSRKSSMTECEKNLNNGALMVKRFFKLLNNEFLKCKSVSEFASHLAVTPNYLSEVVKRETGYSAAHHIQQRVIMEAKNIAQDPALSMKSIAYGLGFDDASHFSKFFKKYSGVNFSVYRKSLYF